MDWTSVRKWIENNKNLRYLEILQMLILFFLLFNCLIHRVSFVFGFRVFFYQFAALFLAGYVLVDLIKMRVKSLTEMVALSYGVGGIVSLLAYFAFVTSGTKTALPYFTVAEFICATIYIYRKKGKIKKYETDRFGFVFCLMVLFIYYCLAVVSVSSVNTLPNETGGGGYYADWGFWAGNNIGFTKGFPADNFRQIGMPFAYHYFSSILMAQSSLCTGVDINLITFYFSSLFGGLFLVFSAYYFATRLIKNKWAI